MKRIKISHVIVYFLAFLWALITFLPLLITFFSSFKNNAEVYLGTFQLPEIWRVSNYVDAVKIANALVSIGNSLLLSIASTAVVTCVGMLASYALSRKSHLRFIRAAAAYFVIGVMVPIHCTIIPISSMASKLSGKNSYVYLLMVYVAFNLAQAIFLYTGFLNGVSRELDEAAKIDGCNDIKLLLKILLPVSKPIIATEAIFVYIWAYGELIFSLTLISDSSKFTVSRALLSFTGEHATALGPKFAFIIMAVIPSLVMYMLFRRHVEGGFMSGAIKG